MKLPAILLGLVPCIIGFGWHYCVAQERAAAEAPRNVIKAPGYPDIVFTAAETTARFIVGPTMIGTFDIRGETILRVSGLPHGVRKADGFDAPYLRPETPGQVKAELVTADGTVWVARWEKKP